MIAAVISDLHVDDNQQSDLVAGLSYVLRREKPDICVLAGDITSDWRFTLKVLDDLEKGTGIPVYFVPGNHDLRNPDRLKISSDDIYRTLCSDRRCLCEHPLVIGNTVWLGDIGWYDGSFADARFTEEDLQRMSKDGRIWNDSLECDWTKDNRKTCGRSLMRLERLLKQYSKYEIITVTHMVPIRELTVSQQFALNPKVDWSYFNAFLGSGAYHELYRKYGVTKAVCGHVHMRKNIVKDDISYYCRCLGYEKEWKTDSWMAEIKDAIEWIEF